MKPFTRSTLTATLVSSLLVCFAAQTAVAQYADYRSTRALAAAYNNQLVVGALDAPAAAEAIAARAEIIPSEGADALLPPDTSVDAVWWIDNILHVDLTVTLPSADWNLSPIDIETLSDAFGTPFMNDSTFGGVNVRVRTNVDEPYGPLTRLVTPQPLPLPSEEPSEQPLPLSGRQPEAGLRGPTAQAARQPVGALTGVTVFCSAGHGWTADNVVDGDATDDKWYLQRPVLLDMCEDYGNLDMLNYLANYAYNAGATVVPMRPVGWQPIEIVLDNDDPGVTYTGTWTDGVSSKYYENGVTNSGVVYKWISADTVETHTARYTPTITVTGFYPVYCFTVAAANRTLQTYRVAHSGGISEVTIDHRNVGSGWIWLGNYYLEAGGNNYVEITNLSTEAGAIVADAIRWGGGMGDIVRPGPATTSGYPRDEECQRYWGQSEWGNNAVGFDSSIWDTSSDDQSDNVGTGGRIAREMNQVPAGGVLVDRWKRIHLEVHTNATNGTVRGQICLITTSGATTYQQQYAETLSNQVDAEMSLIDSEFEHSWVDRSGPTYTSAYGAISTNANSDEFDATIVELAFHDNQEDAELLRDDRVRAAMARACVHGITRFLNGLSGSQVPLAFAPDTPRDFRVEDLGNGDVRLSWVAPISNAAYGDPATGYVVYQSTNGYGFGSPVVVGDVLTTTISGVPTGETRYFRVAATNAGGESMPSEVLAVRRPDAGTADILIVNGFDRLRRQINPTQTFDHPADYAGDVFERQMWRKSNSYDYVVQHAEALAANGYSFASCSNEAVADSYIQLSNYQVIVWILGTESVEDATLTSLEQNRLSTYLVNGGGLFISGADLAYDLINQAHGASFAQNTLGIDYIADDAETYNITVPTGGVFAGLSAFDFNPANGATYDTRSPDGLSPRPGASICLNYSGGAATGAAVQYDAGQYAVVTLGFPFETITSATRRAEIMAQAIPFLLNPEAMPFDYDDDFDVDRTDFLYLLFCFHGPDSDYTPGHFCIDVAGEDDGDIDLLDFAIQQQAFTGSL